MRSGGVVGSCGTGAERSCARSGGFGGGPLGPGTAGTERSSSRRPHFMAPAARPPMMRFWARKKRISIGRETNTAPAMITPQLL